ncbi:MAG: hypothetical protein JWP81_2080 [Ferruginibacter sp.]|nr:hypothetical protein [Ferruginibacter sp.]
MYANFLNPVSKDKTTTSLLRGEGTNGHNIIFFHQ